MKTTPKTGYHSKKKSLREPAQGRSQGNYRHTGGPA